MPNAEHKEGTMRTRRRKKGTLPFPGSSKPKQEEDSSGYPSERERERGRERFWEILSGGLVAT